MAAKVKFDVIGAKAICCIDPAAATSINLECEIVYHQYSPDTLAGLGFPDSGVTNWICATNSALVLSVFGNLNQRLYLALKPQEVSYVDGTFAPWKNANPNLTKNLVVVFPEPRRLSFVKVTPIDLAFFNRIDWNRVVWAGIFV